MNKSLSLFVLFFLSYTAAFAQDNERIISLQQDIDSLQLKIDSLKGEIQNEIVENGYSLTAKHKYNYSGAQVVLKEREWGGATLDTIRNGDIIRIIDKTTGCFKVIHNGVEGYIQTYEIDLSEHPVLNHLESASIRASRSSSANRTAPGYSSGSSGTVQVSGYYRKDGTYVRPHTRSKPRRR